MIDGLILPVGYELFVLLLEDELYPSNENGNLKFEDHLSNFKFPFSSRL